MTIDELKAAIERRGYIVHVEHYQQSVNFHISAGDRWSIHSYTLEDLSQVKMPVHNFVEVMLHTVEEDKKRG